MTTTISQVAADVRRLAPEHAPHMSSARDNCGADIFVYETPTGSRRIPDDIARGALGFAMVLACRPERDAYSWTVWCWRGENSGSCNEFLDSDHGRDRLLSLHQAFLWSRAERTTT